jgi:hypothetical protein
MTRPGYLLATTPRHIERLADERGGPVRDTTVASVEVRNSA